MTTRAQIIAAARGYVTLGVPWRSLGRTATGLDCVGLLVATGATAGAPVVDNAARTRAPQNGFVDLFVAAGFVLRLDSKLTPGSVVILRDKGFPCHCGLLAQDANGRLSLIHATAARRRTFEEPWEPRWARTLYCVLDYPGIED